MTTCDGCSLTDRKFNEHRLCSKPGSRRPQVVLVIYYGIMNPPPILSPVDDQLDALCAALAAASTARDAVSADVAADAAANGVAGVAADAAADVAANGAGREFHRRHPWPAQPLAWCGQRGVFRWSASCHVGGAGWSDADQIRGYLRLGEACLTTAFIITQRTAASTRLAESANHSLRDRLLPDLLAGRAFATVAISQLTTSRRHLAAPVLRARETADGYLFHGFSPWVTGAAFADWIAVGAVLDDGRHLLAAIPANVAGVTVDPPQSLVALEASHTGPVRFENVAVERSWVLAGPSDQVLRTARSGGSGGLQTSALALALASRAIGFLETEAATRGNLQPATASLRREWQAARDQLLEEAGDGATAIQAEVAPGLAGASLAGGSLAGGSPVSRAEALRARVNELALRASQAALVAAKGAGFVAGHPAGRWCREALFFLVWSCPPGVLATHLRDWTDGYS